MPLNSFEVEELDLDSSALGEAVYKKKASTDMEEPLLMAIAEAAASEDRNALSGLVKQVDWRNCRPEALTRVIHSCIFLDMVLLARELANEGRRLFPNDKKIEQLAIVLAPPKIIGTRPASASVIGLEASHRWFQNNSSQHKGQWIAIFNGELLGVAPTLKELYDKIGRDQKTLGTIVVKALS